LGFKKRREGTDIVQWHLDNCSPKISPEGKTKKKLYSRIHMKAFLYKHEKIKDIYNKMGGGGVS